VAAPLGQRRNPDDDFGPAIEQVLAEAPVTDHRLEVLVCRADDARVYVDRLAPADPLDLPFLQEAEQLDLQRQRDVAYLVEEQRAAARLRDLAFGRLDRPGEGALLVPEQLAFEQALGDRSAVDRDAGAAAAAARLVETAREQLLAGAARAEQHDRDVGIGHALDRARDADHLGRRGDQPSEHAVALARALGQRTILRLDAVQVERPANDESELLDVD